jgi:broad-specificity NMP kinase
MESDSSAKLILIGGEAWTGKTTCAEILFRRLHNSAWLDGDDVWRVNPWSLDDPRLRISDVNVAFVLQTYLQSKFEYIIFSSIVLCDPNITERILAMIEGVEYELLSFTLVCDVATLKRRARQRDNNTSPNFLLLHRAMERNTIKIDTANRTPEDVVDDVIAIVRDPQAAGLKRMQRNGIVEWKPSNTSKGNGDTSCQKRY